MIDEERDYILENVSFSNLSYNTLLWHCSSVPDRAGRAFSEIQPVTVDIGSGSFINPAAGIAFPLVTVMLIGNDIHLSCACKTLKKKLCEHQAAVMYNILEREALRIFFDPVLRKAKLQITAAGYGLENEKDLESWFQIEYNNKSVTITPRAKELITLDLNNTSLLKQQLLPSPPARTGYKEPNDLATALVLIFSRHKYYDQLFAGLYQAATTKEGKLKNPLTTADPLLLAISEKDATTLQYYAAVAAVQTKAIGSQPASDIELLKIITANKPRIRSYFHNKEIGETVRANAIVPVSLQELDMEAVLNIDLVEPFYEISGELVCDGSIYPFKNLVIRYQYFIHIGNIFHLVTDPDMLRVIQFFQAHNPKILVHVSKFEAFRREILDNMENRFRIRYSYIKRASSKQLEDYGYDRTLEKLIYLSDQDNYVSIVPVIKYNNVEIPLYSEKQVYDTDLNGNTFLVERDKAAENQLTAIMIRQHPDFEAQLEDITWFYLHKNRFLDNDWFLEAFEEWTRNGIKVLGFEGLKDIKRTSYKAKASVQVNSGIDWFNATLAVRFGKQKAALKQIQQSIRNKSQYVLLDDGTSGLLPAEWIKKIERYLEWGEVAGELIRIPKHSFTEIHHLFEDAELDDETKAEISLFSYKLLNYADIQATPVPAELKAELRDYQVQGFNWLNFLDEHNLGACLADDMGLGKTLQVIAFIAGKRLKRANAVNLVVLPASLIFNWEAELKRFAPSLSFFIHHGSSRLKDAAGFEQYDIILTSYGTMVADIRFLRTCYFDYLILDESQAIKNPGSQRYKAARLLRSRNRIIMTGTPVENNTFDIYSQLSFACPGLLGNRRHFRDIYSVPIDKFQNSKRSLELYKKIQPFILRRTKQQVARELPEKTEMTIYCEMGQEQRVIYDACESELRNYISTKDEHELAKNSAYVLSGLLKLRQICNAPALLKDGGFGKHISSKLETLADEIMNKSVKHKILVFSQFVGMLELIAEILQSKNIGYEMLTGSTKDRGATVNAFQNNLQSRVFLISLKAGGTGLNLTEADYVYLVDPWWNPAVENQAIDRSHRIGQDKHVIAIRLICPNTIEEKVMKLQASKKKLASNLLKSDAAMTAAFSRLELMGLLT